MLRFGSFELDPPRRRVAREGSAVHLTPKAFDLLCVLVDAAPRVVRKAELHERLWPNGSVADSALIALVKEIRRALTDRDPAARLIRTVHRIGYAFDAPILRAGRPRIQHWVVVGRRRIPLTAGENVIGRDPSTPVWLDHPTVSRRHAQLVVDDTGVVLEDLGSKNGTSIAGQRLASAATLRNGERFACGSVLLRYRQSRTDATTATATSRAGR